MLIVNVGDEPGLTLVRSQAAAMRRAMADVAAFAETGMFAGRYPGNIILAGTQAPVARQLDSRTDGARPAPREGSGRRGPGRAGGLTSADSPRPSSRPVSPLGLLVNGFVGLNGVRHGRLGEPEPRFAVLLLRKPLQACRPGRFRRTRRPLNHHHGGRRQDVR